MTHWNLKKILAWLFDPRHVHASAYCTSNNLDTKFNTNTYNKNDQVKRGLGV